MDCKFLNKVLIGVLLLMPVVVFAQKSDSSMVTKITASKIHTVAKGETLLSISRQYNCTADDIRKLNPSVNFDKLLYDSKIKVPASASTTSELKPTNSGSAVVKTLTGTSVSSDTKGASGFSSGYHVVQKGETLSQIAMQYNQTVADLRLWNHLTGDNIAIGRKLIVGKDVLISSVQTSINKEPTVTPDEKPKGIKSVPIKIYNQTDLVETVQKGSAIWEKGTTSPDGLLYGTCSGFPVGSIVKVTNLENNLNVIVKITGELSNVEKNDNVLIKIPETAARQLNASNETFAVQLSSFTPPVLSSK